MPFIYKDAKLKVPNPDQVVEGGCYIVLHKPSGQYRRVKLLRKIGPKSQVSHVDYGDLIIIGSGELRILPPEYAELPNQAVKARLSGTFYNNFAL